MTIAQSSVNVEGIYVTILKSERNVNSEYIVGKIILYWNGSINLFTTVFWIFKNIIHFINKNISSKSNWIFMKLPGKLFEGVER